MSAIDMDLPSETETIWQNLKQVISQSAGFRNWQTKQKSIEGASLTDLDQQVIAYLKETLQTLAY